MGGRRVHADVRRPAVVVGRAVGPHRRPAGFRRRPQRVCRRLRRLRGGAEPRHVVAARFVQGSAAAVMMPSSMALLGQAYPDPRGRARAVAVWALGGALASSSGPVLGGLLASLSWRLIFFVNVPVGAAALVLVVRIARSPKRR